MIRGTRVFVDRNTEQDSHMRFVVVLSLFFLAAQGVTAGDWPQILGPNRIGIAAPDEKIADTWTVAPKTVWSQDVGDGFSGVAVSKGIAIVFHRLRDDEVVQAVDAKTGKQIWEAKFATEFVPSYTKDRGPRAVPLIHAGHVYLYGARGGLYCVTLKDGKTVWSRDTYADFSSKRPSRGEPPEGYFGFSSTPIVVGDKLLLNVGGHQKDAGIVAFNLKTGKTVWTSTDEKASYSSPVAATIGGRKHVIFATRLKVVSVDPKDGRVLFEFPFGRLGPTVTAANPLVLGDYVFITGSYNFGAKLAKVGATGSVEIWQSDDVMSSQYTTCIQHEKTLIGIHGRQDEGLASLRCIDPKTKRILWTETDFGYATLIKADGKLVILKTDGTLVLAAASKTGYKELSSHKVLDSGARALPALSNGLLYVRDAKTLKCLDIR
jgi:outer membrane protein assembly factor BamB